MGVSVGKSMKVHVSNHLYMHISEITSDSVLLPIKRCPNCGYEGTPEKKQLHSESCKQIDLCSRCVLCVCVLYRYIR